MRRPVIGRLLYILVTCHSKSLVAWFVVPPALEQVHYGKWEVWQQISSMEAAYSQLINWSLSAAVPASTSSQWGENILVVGDPKRQSASKVKSLIADSFGFASNGAPQCEQLFTNPWWIRVRAGRY